MLTHQTFSWTPLTPFFPYAHPTRHTFIFSRSFSSGKRAKRRRILCSEGSRGSCDEYCRGRLLFPLTNHPLMSRGVRAAMFYSSLVSGRHARHEQVCEEEGKMEDFYFIFLLFYQEVTILRYPYFTQAAVPIARYITFIFRIEDLLDHWQESHFFKTNCKDFPQKNIFRLVYVVGK